LEAASLVASHGSDAYYDFLLQHGRRPDRKEAAAIGKLLGRQVRAEDGSLQPTKSKTERAAAKQVRQIEKDEQRIDSELNRVIDAVALLAQNQCDPAALIHRIAPIEEEEVIENLDKAVEWFQRFTNHWQHHVKNRIIKAQDQASGNDGSTRTRRLYLVRESDCGG
jgi:hypothetical protein